MADDRHFEKSKKHGISAMDCPILMKCGSDASAIWTSSANKILKF